MSTPVATEATQASKPAPVPHDRPRHGPDALGRFGSFGGRFVPETLMDALNQLAAEYERARVDPEFQARLADYWKHYVGRPSPLFHAERLTQHAGGAEIYLKREDLNHTGAHKINNAIGQVMLAQRMKKSRVIAETGAGQHGVATATACAPLWHRVHGLHGRRRHQAPEAERFQHEDTGSDGRAGDDRLTDLARRDQRSDARLDGLVSDHALHDWQCGRSPPVPDDRPRLSVGDRPGGAGPVPRAGRAPARRRGGVRRRRFQRGRDVRPVYRRFGRRADRRRGRRARAEVGEHAASLSKGRPGILHGSFSYVLQDEDGQTLEVHSISAGLDYPGVGPEHSFWKELGRARYESITDAEALAAYHLTAKNEGILPALESSHALAQAFKEARRLGPGKVLAVCLSGRGDKDAYEVARLRGEIIRISEHESHRHSFLPPPRGKTPGPDAVRDGRRP